MSDRIGRLRAAWEVLGGLPQRTEGLRVYALEEAPRFIRATLSAAAERGLLLGVDLGERISIPRALRAGNGAALESEVAHFEVPGLGERRFIHVWCRDHDANQAFEAFCALLWRSVGSEEVTTALARCNEEFRRLLAVSMERGSGTTIGIVGELWVLRELVRREPSMVFAWSGPKGARHDFRRGVVAMEVKTTLRSEARDRRVRISDIDQLDPPADGSLYLCLVRLEQAMDGSLGVTSLVEDIRACLTPDGAVAFEECLASLGELDGTSRFELREQVAYHVQGSFPRLTTEKLTSGALEPGISHVSYDLSLEIARDFEVPIDTAFEALLGASS